MLGFLALTYYKQVVKNAKKSYWTVDSILSTPFPRNIIHVQSFTTFSHFITLAIILKYLSKSWPGYDPRKKLGKSFTTLQERFVYVWIPKQHPSIDEDTISSKAQTQFKVNNPNKLDKYVMKNVKLIIWF